MEQFVRVIFNNKKDISEALNESIFPGIQLMETSIGDDVMHIPLPRTLTEDESDTFANKLANYIFEMGHTDFDIEISTGDDE